ncbi:MAG: ribonuclease III domain-containing protein [Erysipelotrichaceae bacterium]|nr:ribonuclease III domain-containing protein [Erysipelotrichaceae bacterium]
MNIKELSANSLSFIGDAVYTLRVREFYIANKYQSPKMLQKLCTRYNCAKGQMHTFERLNSMNFFKEDELEAFKRGRNAISHIPKNGDLISYQIASGLEAITGYLYLTDKERLEEFFTEVFKGGQENE